MDSPERRTPALFEQTIVALQQELRTNHKAVLEKLELLDAKTDDIQINHSNTAKDLKEHIAKEDLWQAAIEANSTIGFPNSDAIAHKTYHQGVIEDMIESKKRWREVGTFVLKSIAWAALAGTAVAVWTYIKVQVNA